MEVGLIEEGERKERGGERERERERELLQTEGRKGIKWVNGSNIDGQRRSYHVAQLMLIPHNLLGQIKKFAQANDYREIFSSSF